MPSFERVRMVILHWRWAHCCLPNLKTIPLLFPITVGVKSDMAISSPSFALTVMVRALPKRLKIWLTERLYLAASVFASENLRMY